MPAAPVGKRIANLLDRYVKLRGMPHTQLARALRIDPTTLTKRLERGEELRIGDLVDAAQELNIPADEIVEALFPGQATSLSESARLQRVNDQLHADLRDARHGKSEPQSIVRDILRGGGWGVTAIPEMYAPDDASEELVSIRLAIAPYPNIPGASVADIRAQAERELPGVMNQAAVMSATSPTKAAHPGPAGDPAPHALHLSLPILAREREPLSDRERHRFLGGPSQILVISTSARAHPTFAAAIIAGALGWGLRSTVAGAKRITPRMHVTSGADRRSWNRREATAQLQNILSASEPHHDFVYAHWGTSNADGEIHPLIQAMNLADSGRLDPRLPFVVLLSEDDHLLRFAAGRGYQEYDSGPSPNESFVKHLKFSRNTLAREVNRPTMAANSMILPVRATEHERNDESSTGDSWYRATEIAATVLKKLGGGSPLQFPRDPVAARFLTARKYLQ